eukprot:308723_1
MAEQEKDIAAYKNMRLTPPNHWNKSTTESANQELSEVSTKSTIKSEPPPEPNKKWNCVMCTSRNDTLSDTCPNCRGPSPIAYDLWNKRICSMCLQINPTEATNCENCNEKLLGIIVHNENVSGTIDYNEPAQMIWKQDRKSNYVKPSPSIVAEPTISKSTIIKRKKNKNKARKNRKNYAPEPKPIR